MNNDLYSVTGASAKVREQPIDGEVEISLKQNGQHQNVRLPMRDAMYLASALLAIVRDLKLQQYVQLDDFRGQ